MAATRTLEAAARRAYWNVVRACLVQLHGWSGRRADGAIAEFRRRLRASSNPLTAVIVYHAEEFDLACDLADHPLDYFEHRAAYEAILAQHYDRPDLWGPAAQTEEHSQELPTGTAQHGHQRVGNATMSGHR
jgi:hypothetical protein